MRDEIIEAEAAALEEQARALLEPEPEPEQEPAPEEPAPSRPKTKRRRRNHRLPVDYVAPLDQILADSYVKQKSAHEVITSFENRLQQRGIDATTDKVRFELAASNMAIVEMMREMAWLFGLGPEHADRIAGHTIDKLFGPPKEKK
jgi:hypothetical protein